MKTQWTKSIYAFSIQFKYVKIRIRKALYLDTFQAVNVKLRLSVHPQISARSKKKTRIRPATLLKKTLAQVFSRKFLQNFQGHPFAEHLRTTASETRVFF